MPWRSATRSPAGSGNSRVWGRGGVRQIRGDARVESAIGTLNANPVLRRLRRDASALFDQSHHMTDLYLEGTDVIRLLSDLGVNTFENAAVNKAKQLVACNHDGYVIGDGILFFVLEHRVSLVGRPAAPEPGHFHRQAAVEFSS